jgi:DNA-binding FadR family transcriptional regulator
MTSSGAQSARLKAMKPRQLLYQAVQEEIKAYIVANSLGPGDALPPETELAQQLNISRNSVREAVKSLEALGILEARPGSGLFVREFSFDPILDNLAFGLRFDAKQLSDILEVRYHIEYGMVERVIQAVTLDQFQRLRNLLRQMEAIAAEGSYSADLDQDFHRCLYENVDNSVLLKILDIFWAIYREAQERVLMPEPADPLDTYQRHVDILRALEAGDVSGMQAAVRAHRLGIQLRVRMLEQAQRQAGQPA